MHSEHSLIMPLEEADPSLLGAPMHNSSSTGYACPSGSSPAAASGWDVEQRSRRVSHRESDTRVTASAPTVTTVGALAADAPSHLSTSSAVANDQLYLSEASLEFQCSLLQQHVQQANRERERLKAELHRTNARLTETRQQLNEQKAAYTSVAHRYGTTVEKLTSSEGDVRRLEEQLVKERQQRQQLLSEKEEQQLAFREAEWAQERLQRRLEQAEAGKGLDPKEVQQTLEDRARYIPTVEVRRMETEMHNVHQAMINKLLASMESLSASAEEFQTNFFVTRSAVLSAATDMEARLQRAEAALADVDKQWLDYREGVEQETNQFLLTVMAENKDLWQQLALLQNEHDVVVSELKLRSSYGGAVPMEEHAYLQHQLEVMTERLGKAQELVQSQTVLARAHEAEMQELLEANDVMQQRLEELERLRAQQEQASTQKSSALAEAETALREASSQIEDLHRTIREERTRAEAVVAELKATQQTVHEEYDTRVRQLEHECEVAEDMATTLQRTLDETTSKMEIVEKNYSARSKEFETYKERVSAEKADAMERQREDMQRVRAVMAEELASLRSQLEKTQETLQVVKQEKEDAQARENALAVTHRTMQEDFEHLTEEVERQRGQLKDALEQRQRAQAEVEQLRAASGHGSTLAQEMQRRLQLLEKEKAEMTAALANEQSRQERRYANLQGDWKASEKARGALQEELKTLRARCAELENARIAEERYTQDKEQLMRENIRLHEQYQLIQTECGGLREEIKELRLRGADDVQWKRQLEDLQRRLRELPELRQAAEAARRDALTAKEETELLRRERDHLSKKLDTFLEDAKQQACRESDFERVCREASAAAQRIGVQVSAAKENSVRYHVFRNTHPTGRLPSSVSDGATTSASVSRVGGAWAALTPSSASRPSPHRGSVPSADTPDARIELNAAGTRSPHSKGTEAEGTTERSDAASAVHSSTSSPSRPWR